MLESARQDNHMIGDWQTGAGRTWIWTLGVAVEGASMHDVKPV